jgi:hypothetical protein
VSSQPVLPLSTEAPPVLAPVPNYDVDRDNDTGLLLKHNSQTQNEQPFRWTTDGGLRLRGTVGVELDATAKNHTGPFTLDVRLRACRRAACTDITYGRQSADSPADGYASLVFDLGVIDVELLAGDAIELVVVAPPDSNHQVWLAYDTAATASRVSYTPI